VLCYLSGVYLKHGRSNLPEYRCWQQIKQRCLNPNHRMYPDYGGRGISVDDRWVGDFEAFFADVGPRPSSKHSLDRIDVNKGYEPGNCRWATWKVQNNNQRQQGAGARALGHLRPTDTDRTTNFKHGKINTPEYRAWGSMKTRCLNPSYTDYPRWGGRGIKIHQPWVEDFMAFYRDVGPRPSPKHSLDRIDNDGDYEPGNVRWATKLQQTQNRRPCKTGPDHANFRHGGAATPEHKTWGSIKTRCFNPKHDGYARYGAKGITMCQAWRDSFEIFLADMGPKPEGCTVLRVDLDGHYSCGDCPECEEKGWEANCRWATRTEVNRHRRPSSRSGKLDEAQVAEIRQRLAGGESQPSVARAFGVGRSLVGKIWRREVWV
jgi:hypothetical protein